MTPLGIGLVYVAELLPLLRDGGDVVSVVEVEPQTLWRRRDSAPDKIELDQDAVSALRSLPQRRLAHGIGMPVGGTVPGSNAEMRLFAETLDELSPVWFSEHLSFNRATAGPRVRLAGFLLPPRQVADAVGVAAYNINVLARRMGRPFAFETGVNYLRPCQDEMDDGAFLAAVAESADCGILLDLHNLWTNERNGRQPWRDVVASLPADRIWEIHVAGGSALDGFWLDSHAALVPDELLEALEALLSTLPCVGSVVFEALPAHVARIGLDAIGRQLELLRGLWDRRVVHPATARGTSIRRAPIAAAHMKNVEEWESALVSHILDGQSCGGRSALFAFDPGIELYRRLVADFRAGSIAQCLRGTITLLFLALGTQRTEELMHEYQQEADAQAFAEDEALQFSAFVSSRHLALPFLSEVLAFESAVLNVARAGVGNMVQFEHDPELLFGSLIQGRLPAALPTQVTCIYLRAR